MYKRQFLSDPDFMPLATNGMVNGMNQNPPIKKVCIRWFARTCIPFILWATAACVPVAMHPTKERILVTVNGEKITQDRYNYYLEERRRVLPKIADREEERQVVMDELINRKLLVQAANRHHVDEQPDVLIEINRQRAEVRAKAAGGSDQDLQLALAYVEEMVLVRGELRLHFLEKPITEQAIKEHTIHSEFRVRHIAVQDRQMAADAIAKLKAGGDFAAMARAYSIDTKSKDSGGELGWISQEDPIDTQIFGVIASTKKGEIAPLPAKSSTGWHVINVEDVRPHAVRSSEKLAERVRANLMQQGIDDFLKQLREKSTIHILAEPGRYVEDSRTTTSIQAAFSRSKDDIYRVYAEALRRNPGLLGKTIYQITVDADGRVVETTIKESTLPDSRVTDAVSGIIAKMDFGMVRHAGNVTFTYPIEFQPR